MARVTYVKAARQRYRTVPVLDDQGNPVKIKLTGRSRKGGGEVFITKTAEDRTQPLPNRHCDRCKAEIEVGQPYKWVQPKNRGKRVRCGTCPTWDPWELSDSLSAKVQQIQSEGSEALSQADDEGSMRDAQSTIVEQIRELAEAKSEAADNLEEGFQHETSQSQEIRDTADQLGEWADEVENVDLDDFPEPGDVDCETCQASGHVDNDQYDPDQAANDEDYDEEETVDCPDCNGDGTVEGDAPSQDDVDAWIEEKRDEISAALDNCPV